MLTDVVGFPALVELYLGVLVDALEVSLGLEDSGIIGSIARHRAEEVVHAVERVVVSEEAELENIRISHKAYREGIGILVYLE